MNYTKIRELGSGGFGVVYQVADEIGNSFALKEFRPSPDVQAVIAKGGVALESLKARFRREVKYQSQLKSDNIVRIFDHNLDAPNPWFVMELALGTLQTDLLADRSLGGNPSKALFDILGGLDDLHKRGIVHRDLKPVNVLKLQNVDGSFRYAISDFGLISAIASETTTLTQTGHGGGTPIYAAPELITKFKYATSVADIYSVGAILHDIFDGGPRTPYLELTADGPCREIIEKCTKTNPGRRYADVASLRADIYSALAGQTLSFSSDVEKNLVDLLNLGNALSSGEWDRVYSFLSKEDTTAQMRKNVFAALTTDHINQLAEDSSELLNALGIEFSDYVREQSHDFNYCDVLADKIELLHDAGSVALKAHALVTLLIMGIGHNRWFVERKFARLAGPFMDAHVAERIQMDAVADNIPLADYLDRLENSINITRKDLHNLLGKVKA
ncbi:MAG: serine/threonine-protein kinase [Ramlibacter sp.]